MHSRSSWIAYTFHCFALRCQLELGQLDLFSYRSNQLLAVYDELIEVCLRRRKSMQADQSLTPAVLSATFIFFEIFFLHDLPTRSCNPKTKCGIHSSEVRQTKKATVHTAYTTANLITLSVFCLLLLTHMPASAEALKITFLKLVQKSVQNRNRTQGIAFFELLQFAKT